MRRRSLREIQAALVLASALSISGCGKNAEAPAFKGPVTVEQAATVLDLSTLPLVDGSKTTWPRGVASLSYQGPGDVKSVFEFQRKKLLQLGWKAGFMPAEVTLSAMGVELSASK